MLEQGGTADPPRPLKGAGRDRLQSQSEDMTLKPGHSFVLIDKAGNQRWYGEYPSMFLSTADLLKEVRAHLNA